MATADVIEHYDRLPPNKERNVRQVRLPSWFRLAAGGRAAACHRVNVRTLLDYVVPLLERVTTQTITLETEIGDNVVDELGKYAAVNTLFIRCLRFVSTMEKTMAAYE
jgi:hypothetical protein